MRKHNYVVGYGKGQLILYASVYGFHDFYGIEAMTLTIARQRGRMLSEDKIHRSKRTIYKLVPVETIDD